MNFRAPLTLADAIDRAVAADADAPSRSDLIRRLLTEALTAKGYLRP